MTQLQQICNQVQTFQFAGVDLRATLVDGEPWFFADDLCTPLGVRTRDVMSALHEDEKMRDTVAGHLVDLVNESGIYSTIFRSRKPEAVEFRRWVTSEVLPSIRKTGSYAVAQLSPARRLLVMAQQLVDHEDQIAALAVHADEVNEHLRVNDARLDSIEHNAGAYTILAYAKLQNMVIGGATAARFGKLATRLFRERTGLEPAQVRDERYGLVNLYPENLLKEVFDQ